jgi:hypothetical protein
MQNIVYQQVIKYMFLSDEVMIKDTLAKNIHYLAISEQGCLPQPMLMARHHKIAKLFDEDFG